AQLTLDYQKRIMKAPNGTRTLALDLVQDGGRLVGELAGHAGLEDQVTLASTDEPESIPAPVLTWTLLAVLTGAAVARRRR
ncbi:MAG: hypothetical protein R3185_02470, partial [Candidatus Thermoplasmatota archaeon]|nr:hypothetical protein [Candidatus Thermoplasmatota archaeon]